MYAQLDAEVATRQGRKANSKDMSGLSEKFEGVTEPEGEYYNAGELEEDEEEERKEENRPHAFYAVLDTGLARTNTGAVSPVHFLGVALAPWAAAGTAPQRLAFARPPARRLACLLACH